MTIFKMGMSVVALVTAVGAASVARGAEGPVAPPTVPAAIAVPAAAKLVKKVHAVGAQIYVCGAAPGDAAKFAWTLKAPDAVLSDAASGAAVGTHGAGPSWTAKDGSSVGGKKAADAPAPGADAIPWLLVRAVSNTGKGVFSKVTFIQRVNTKGGKAPSSGCEAATVKTEKRVDYTADYYFFEGGT